MNDKSKSPMVFVKPKEGARIRQPDRGMRVMSDEGDFVSTDDAFYSRMIASGDLIISEKKEPAKEQQASVAKEEVRHKAGHPRE